MTEEDRWSRRRSETNQTNTRKKKKPACMKKDRCTSLRAGKLTTPFPSSRLNEQIAKTKDNEGEQDKGQRGRKERKEEQWHCSLPKSNFVLLLFFQRKERC
jgi:hypothetical protein